MKLTDLNPRFIRYRAEVDTWKRAIGDPSTWHERGRPTEDVTGEREHRDLVDSLPDAQGVMFLCPKCFRDHGNSDIGTHYVEVTFEGRGVRPDHGCHDSDGRPTRWQVAGSSLEDLSTQPSVLVVGGCGWHGYITNGEVTII